MRAPHALRLLYIRSPLAYAYAELNAHGARYARSLSFARMEVLRTSQDRQIELSLSLDFSLRSKQKSHGFAATLFLVIGYVLRTPSDNFARPWLTPTPSLTLMELTTFAPELRQDGSPSDQPG